MSNALLTSRQGAVMTVTINRPDQLNILGEPGDGDAFRKVFDAINEDRSIKCVIFTGAGAHFLPVVMSKTCVTEKTCSLDRKPTSRIIIAIMCMKLSGLFGIVLCQLSRQ